MWERYLGERAMVPLGIFHSISIYAICVFAFMTRYSMLIYSYYIPIYYQAAKGHSAVRSGIDLLPLMLGVVVTVISAGQITARIGYYWPFLVVGPIFLSVGSGLLYTVGPHTAEANLAGYQILCGIGIGMTLQNGLFAMQ
jgi:MFS family permease